MNALHVYVLKLYPNMISPIARLNTWLRTQSVHMINHVLDHILNLMVGLILLG